MKTIKQEEGFVLVTTLLIMLVLTIIGISATTNTSIELQIAGNDRSHKQNFYQTEGGDELATEIVEQSIACPGGFNDADGGGDGKTYLKDISQNPPVETEVYVYNLAIWANSPPTYSCSDAPTNADAAYPKDNIASGVDVGYLQMGGASRMLPGGALQMAAGYEGKGKAAAQGGVERSYDVYSQYRSFRGKAENVILYGWRHVVGSAGTTCNY